MVRWSLSRRRALLASSFSGASVLMAAATLGAAGVPSAVAAGPPDGRAYELVSPPDKSAGMVAFPTGFPGYATAPATPGAWNQAAPDGNSAMYFSFAAFADPNTGMPASYKAVRSDSGWSSKMWTPMPRTAHPSLYEGYATIAGANDDLTLGFIQSDAAFDADDQDFAGPATGTGNDVYSTLGTPDSLAWLSRPNTPGPDTVQKQARFVGNSGDGSHAFFQSPEALVPEAASQAGGSSLYERVGGVTRLVALRNDGSALNECGAVLGMYNYNRLFNGASDPDVPIQPTVANGVRNAISKDGNSVFFTSPDPSGANSSADPSCASPFQVYLRRNGGETIEISRSQRTVPDTPAQAEYQGAADDGSKVFFISNAALTDDAVPGNPGQLYEYDVASGVLTLLTTASQTLKDGAITGGVSRVSDDGSAVYALLKDGTDIELVVFSSGATRVVARLAAVDDDLIFSRAPIKLTRDGRLAAFASSENLTSFDAHGMTQIYLYSADDGSLRCVSCVDGVVPTSDATFGGDLSSNTMVSYPEIRNMTSDGQVYFQTNDGLVDGDDNAAPDVYGWRDGKLSLITDGRDKRGSYLFDVAANGRDVFFGTTASLVQQDGGNGDSDIYDARIGGGFPGTTVTPPCTGDQCQGVPTAPPVFPQAGSANVTGDEQVDDVDKPTTRPAVTVGSVSAAARKGFARSGKLVLSVRTATAGKVTAKAKARIGKRQVVVASASRPASSGSTVRLTLRLSRKARRQLAVSHRLKVSITVAMPGAKSKTVTLALSSPTGSKRR